VSQGSVQSFLCLRLQVRDARSSSLKYQPEVSRCLQAPKQVQQLCSTASVTMFRKGALHCTLAAVSTVSTHCVTVVSWVGSGKGR
jgi:hypothetical protein